MAQLYLLYKIPDRDDGSTSSVENLDGIKQLGSAPGKIGPRKRDVHTLFPTELSTRKATWDNSSENAEWTEDYCYRKIIM